MSATLRILLIEDDTKAATFIRKGLSENDMHVDIASDGKEGEILATDNPYDCIILDVLLPKLNGIDLCRKIRSVDTTTPILMLSALISTEDKVTGLTAGADDYLIKPFDFAELVARIHALVRRNTESVSNLYMELGDMEVNLETRIVKRGGREIKLTNKEFQLLTLLLQNKGHVVTRAEIEKTLWQPGSERESNVVDVYINFLRKKIDAKSKVKLIQTVVGVGYMIRFNLR
ncbi:MAG TPA: response regulator transcription factor [Bacteroidales bacterium]|nr:response regulator transcription factor [Bacteroidales bacterium]HRZ49775.1 response regulator transcription factor [Bacteroidales bacterium]